MFRKELDLRHGTSLGALRHRLALVGCRNVVACFLPEVPRSTGEIPSCEASA